ncbi:MULTISPECIES: M10 family metallopeptidase C-terminal domain-containing protein [unclassified Bradyrhizobium]|uniref:M10 family metallopeptidase C-terminal domain-containing protein n=1 Tax=unclassified Bradyrhizobium TaxID=2631580 RepID=UPI0032099F00
MHELGHALGLKHSQEAGGPANVAVPSGHDDSEYTVMSYRSYVGASTTSGYTNEAYGYPQTYMANDILALQAMYGANYTTQSSNMVYAWSPTTGQEIINGVGQLAPGGGAGGSANRIYETVWDGGGVDTYDLSNYTTNLGINLNPGASSLFSSVQLANLGNGHSASGNAPRRRDHQDDAQRDRPGPEWAPSREHRPSDASASLALGGRSKNSKTGGSQDNATITGLANGGFVVTWEDLSGTLGDDEATSVKAQMFAADGSKVSSEFLVNTATASDQLKPTISALPNGGFVVTWYDFSQTGGDSSGSSIKAQIYTADGSKAYLRRVPNCSACNFNDRGRWATLSHVATWQEADGQQSGLGSNRSRFDGGGAS